MAKNNNLTDFVTDIANHIRGKVGLSATTKINPQSFSDYVGEMPHLVDISEQFPRLVANVVKGDEPDTIYFPADFPWQYLSDGSNFLSVIVFHAVLSYKFSEAVGAGAGIIGTLSISYSPNLYDVKTIFLNGADTDLHTFSCWFGMLAQNTSNNADSYHLSIDYNRDDPNSDKFEASIVVTPYIVKIGDRVLSLQTCKGEE